MKKKGAVIRGIYEQAPMSRLVKFGLGLWSEPGKIFQAIGLRQEIGGVRYRGGCWPIEAIGDEAVRSVKLTDGRSTWSVDCDYLACGFGLVPNLELPTLLGCAVEDGRTVVGAPAGRRRYRASTAPERRPGSAGSTWPCSKGRSPARPPSGDAPASLPCSKSRRDRARKFAGALEPFLFALRDELRHLARPDTIVCRCEDVTAGALQGRTSWVDAKLQTRCGMGPCQGRHPQGAAVSFLHGWEPGSVRPPIFPVGVANLAGALEKS